MEVNDDGEDRSGSTAASTTPAASEPEYVDKLERLSQLRDQGILGDEEFEAKKKQPLGI
jgi:Short C-terminal domain